MTCPSCAVDLGSPVQVRYVAICPSCLRTVAIEGEVCRLATSADTLVLSEAELTNLRDLRKAARKGRAA